jgi:single-strand DNA-binding protein
MAGSFAKVQILGYLGADPEVRTFQNGSKVVNMRIATTEKWRDRNSNETREKTEWHQIAIFNEAIGKVAEQYLRKGSHVLLTGQLETRKWQDKDGIDRWTTEVVLRPFGAELHLLGGGSDQGQGEGSEQRGNSGGGARRDTGRSSHPNAGPDGYQAPHNSGGGSAYGGGRNAYGGQTDDAEIPF